MALERARVRRSLFVDVGLGVSGSRQRSLDERGGGVDVAASARDVERGTTIDACT